MRVKVEFETTADVTNGRWFGNVMGRLTELKSEWITIIECSEPTEPGYYKVTYSTGVRTIVSRTLNDWYIIGSSRPNTWQELGNIVVAERIEL